MLKKLWKIFLNGTTMIHLKKQDELESLNSEFIICLFVFNKVFALGLVLSKVLQQTSIDLKEAMSSAQNKKQELKEIRLNAEKEFGVIFERVKSLAEKIDIVINMPRISKRQTNRGNIQTDDPEIFYRVSVFIPYIDKFINELDERFTNHQSTLTSFNPYLKKVVMKKILYLLQNSIVKIWKILEIVMRYSKMS